MVRVCVCVTILDIVLGLRRPPCRLRPPRRGLRGGFGDPPSPDDENRGLGNSPPDRSGYLSGLRGASAGTCLRGLPETR
eukprot:395037-Pyramimonas_sp.AAC.1